MCISCHVLSFFWTLPPSLYWSRYMLGKNLHVYWHKINSWELTYPLPRHKCIKNMWRLRLHRNGSMILKFVIILDGWKRYLEQWHSKSIICIYIYIPQKTFTRYKGFYKGFYILFHPASGAKVHRCAGRWSQDQCSSALIWKALQTMFSYWNQWVLSSGLVDVFVILCLGWSPFI